MAPVHNRLGAIPKANGNAKVNGNATGHDPEAVRCEVQDFQPQTSWHPRSEVAMAAADQEGYQSGDNVEVPPTATETGTDGDLGRRTGLLDRDYLPSLDETSHWYLMALRDKNLASAAEVPSPPVNWTSLDHGLQGAQENDGFPTQLSELHDKLELLRLMQDQSRFATKGHEPHILNKAKDLENKRRQGFYHHSAAPPIARQFERSFNNSLSAAERFQRSNSRSPSMLDTAPLNLDRSKFHLKSSSYVKKDVMRNVIPPTSSLPEDEDRELFGHQFSQLNEKIDNLNSAVMSILLRSSQDYNKHQWQLNQVMSSVDQCCQLLLDIQRELRATRATANRARVVPNQAQPPLQPSAEATVPQPTGAGAQQVKERGQNRVLINPFDATFNFDMAYDDRPDWNFFNRNSSGNSGDGAMMPVTSVAVGPDNSESALNNQVPPGMRANNYWDNFRSFSRQNRLSSTTANAATRQTLSTTAPIIAQVTPRQLQGTGDDHTATAPAAHRNPSPHGLSRNRYSALVEPYFSNINSPSRPKRKQKINREQNRETFFGSKRNLSSSITASVHLPAGSGENPNANSAARVYPMPQLSSRNYNHLGEDRSNERQSPSSAIVRSIYGQVNQLISQHETSPERLQQIFQDLQVISREGNNTSAPEGGGGGVNLFSLNTTTTSNSSGLAGALRQLEGNVRTSNVNFNTANSTSRHWMDLSTRQNRSSDDHTLSADDEDDAMFKLTINERIALTEGEKLVEDQQVADPQPTAIDSAEYRMSPLSSSNSVSPRKRRVNNLLPMEDPARNDLNGVAAVIPATATDSGAVAVPKNSQRNFFPREGRPKVQPVYAVSGPAAVRKDKPRNLVGGRGPMVSSGPLSDESAGDSPNFIEREEFLNVNIGFAASEPSTVDNRGEEAGQSEMAEADQACSPESVKGAADNTRVPASEIEKKMKQENDENCDGLVEEVVPREDVEDLSNLLAGNDAEDEFTTHFKSSTPPPPTSSK